MLHDCDSNALERVHQQIRALIEEGIARRKTKRGEWKVASKSLTQTTDLNLVVDQADLVIWLQALLPKIRG